MSDYAPCGLCGATYDCDCPQVQPDAPLLLRVNRAEAEVARMRTENETLLAMFRKVSEESSEHATVARVEAEHCRIHRERIMELEALISTSARRDDG